MDRFFVTPRANLSYVSIDQNVEKAELCEKFEKKAIWRVLLKE